MKAELALKASKLVTEITDLKKCFTFLDNRQYGSLAHFEFLQHYGSGADNILISEKCTKRILGLVMNVIAELEQELESM